MIREVIEIVSDKEVAEVFAGTNFGKSAPRDVLDDTVFKIAGGFSSGSTALSCCQELGLIGKNKFNPVLTKKGKRYLYYAWIRASIATSAIAEVHEYLKSHQKGRMSYRPELMAHQMQEKLEAAMPWLKGEGQ